MVLVGLRSHTRNAAELDSWKLWLRMLMANGELRKPLSALLPEEELTQFQQHPLTEGGGVDILAVRTRLIDNWLDRPTWPLQLALAPQPWP